MSGEDVKLRLSEHAKEKVRIRKITLEAIRDVLRSSDHRFYDIINYTEVAVKEVDLYGERIGLVVVFTKENDVYHIVTLYPSRQFMEEIRRKVKFGRWLSI
jgi:hypothetical protein